jgi:heme-degrading monooxygenase HmoA
MIVRRWEAVAKPGHAAAYRQHLEDAVLPQLRALPGFIGLTLMRTDRQGRIGLVVESRWHSMDAIRAFAGAAPEAAVVEQAARAVLSEFDDFATHYEVMLEAGSA